MSAIITPRHNVYLNKKRIPSKEHDYILCYDSFIEALKNCDFAKHLSSKRLFDNTFFNSVKVSYVSKNTFFENKYGFGPEHLYKEAIPTIIVDKNYKPHVPKGFYHKLTHSLRHSNRFTFDVQVRTFKTDRSVKAEKIRNPSLSSRLKNMFGLGAPETTDAKTNTEVPPPSSERLKSILATEDPNMTEAEKQRMKVAFAEGYLLGNNPKTSKAAKYFKVVQQVLTIAIFLAIVISLMASASGSVFR